MPSPPIFRWISCARAQIIGRAVAATYLPYAQEMPPVWAEIHILFYYFNINNDYYLHNLVLILQNEFTYSFQVYISSLTQNIGL